MCLLAVSQFAVSYLKIRTDKIWNQDSDLQSPVDTHTSISDSGRGCSVLGAFDGLISNPHLSAEISSLHPTRGHASQLWQIYLNNVDVFIKILHVPTTQAAVFAAINNPKQTLPDLDALLFSIYFAAITSLRPAEVEAGFGGERKNILQGYQRGLELSLHAASFLDSPTVTALQAMSIYLVRRSFCPLVSKRAIPLMYHK